MRAITIEPGQPAPDLAADDIVITEDVKLGGERFRKGHRLQAEEAPLLAQLDHPIHAVVLEPGDVHEDDAGGRLAAAVAGPGLAIRGPKFSRYNLVAATKGLLRVNAEALLRLNRLPGVAIFTLEDRLPIVAGKIVTGVKVTPVAVAEATVREAEQIAAASPVVQVVPFRPLRVGVIITEGPEWRVRERFQESVKQKIGWYGGEVIGFSDQPPDAEAIAAEIERLDDAGVDLVLAAGGARSTRSIRRCARSTGPGQRSCASARPRTRGACSGWPTGATSRFSTWRPAPCFPRRPSPMWSCRGS